MLTKFLHRFSTLTIIGIISIFVITNCSKHHYDHKKRAEHMVEKISDELDLSKKQKGTLIKIKDEILSKLKTMKPVKDAMIKEIISQIKSDKVNQNKLNKLFAEHHSKKIKMRKFHIKKFAEFHKILTPKQRLKLAELVKKFSKRFHH